MANAIPVTATSKADEASITEVKGKVAPAAKPAEVKETSKDFSFSIKRETF